MSSRLSRRQFLQFAAAATSLSVLAQGCTAVTPGSTGDTAAPAQAGNVVELWAPHPLDENIKIADFVAENFTPDHPDITFNFTRVPSEWEQKFRTAAAGGQLPDIFAVDGINLPAYASRGLCAELDEVVIPADVLEDYYPSARAEMQYRGATYAVVLETNSQAVRLNMDQMNEAGVSAPVTWDELIEVGKQLTIDQNGNNAASADFDASATTRWAMETWCCLGEGATWMITPWIWMNGGDILDEETREVKIAEEPAVQAIQFLSDLVKVHGIWPRAGAVQAGPEGTWYGQLVTMSWTGAFDLANLTQTNPPGFTWDIAPFPHPANMEQSISGVGGWLFSAWKEGKNLESTMQLMNFMTTPEWHRHVSEFGYAVTGRRSIAEERLAVVPQLQIFLDAMLTGRARPRSNQYPLITEALQQAFDASIFGDTPVEQALSEAATKIADAVAQEQAE
jgi:multiple sugar transport system substrate-binding protein